MPRESGSIHMELAWPRFTSGEPSSAAWMPRCDVSIRLACEVFQISQTCYRYNKKRSAENELIADWLVRLTTAQRNWDFGLCFLYLRNVKGFIWNHKRVYRSLPHLPRAGTEPANQTQETLCLMTFNVFLSDHSFEPKEEIRGIWMLVISLVLVGFVMICFVVLPTISVTTQDLKMLIAKIAAMIPTGFIVGAIFLFLGQAIHLIKLERKSGRTLELRDFNERLRWRHDYVKYHMPAPVRKLNLRLFNQHVETYERLQKQTKASRT